MTFVERIEILIGQARRDRLYDRFDDWDMRRELIAPDAYAGEAGPETYVVETDDVGMISEPAELLLELYASANAEERKFLRRSYGVRAFKTPE